MKKLLKFASVIIIINVIWNTNLQSLSEPFSTANTDQSVTLNPGLSLSSIFSNGCVLQRNQSVALWGSAMPGETLELTVKDQRKTTVPDNNGHWRMELDPEPAGGPYTLTITGTQSESVVLTDVYFGDVWLLTGQSNMHQTVAAQYGNFPEYYPQIPNATDNFDDMRFALINIKESLDGPVTEPTMLLPWNRWETGKLGAMSAVGYFFGRSLKASLEENGMGDIPLGFIKVSRGGTAIEQWISADALNAMEEPLIPRDDKPASGYYNGMIAPVQDYSIKGILWYQGEANTDKTSRIKQYPLLFKTLVESWREEWKNPDIPFYFVQLAPFRKHKTFPLQEADPWALMREAQTECLSIPNTGMVCIIESGIQGDINV